MNPKDCVVFEDILPAVEGAKKAKMKVISVYDKAAEHQKDALIKASHKYINSFKELLN